MNILKESTNHFIVLKRLYINKWQIFRGKTIDKTYVHSLRIEARLIAPHSTIFEYPRARGSGGWRVYRYGSLPHGAVHGHLCAVGAADDGWRGGVQDTLVLSTMRVFVRRLQREGNPTGETAALTIFTVATVVCIYVIAGGDRASGAGSRRAALHIIPFVCVDGIVHVARVSATGTAGAAGAGAAGAGE